MKNILRLTTFTILFISLAACSKTEILKFDETEIIIDVKETYDLKHNANKSDKIEYTMSKEGIILISGDEIKGLTPGEITLTATSEKTKGTVTIIVIVKAINEPNIEVESINITGLKQGQVGDEIILTTTVLPVNATIEDIIWKTLNEDLAIVTEGKVTLLKEGKVIIEVTIGNKHAQHEILISSSYYNVTFLDNNGIKIKSDLVLSGDDAIAPNLNAVDGFVFMRWDQNINNITKDLIVRPLYYKSYVSYSQTYNVSEPISIANIIDNIPRDNPFSVFANIFEGGFRDANQIHYYNEENIINRNHYGFEIAVDNNGLVVEKNTLVSIPIGGFILSGHSNTATLLSNAINIGDLIEYDTTTKTAYLYRDENNSKLVALNIEIYKTFAKIEEAKTNYKALNYDLINDLLNNAIDWYNTLINNFNVNYLNEVNLSLLEISFLLIESKPVQTNAVWHYPTRSGSYLERNLDEIKELLDEYQRIGINRVYLNTNFNGGSVYKSNYLVQQMTAYNNYEGYKDYLEAFIEEAHQRDILVYAWTNTLIAGDGRNNAIYSNKGWILEGYNGEDNFNGMYFLDIGNEEVQAFLKDVFTELANEYNLDGIEFDFIRYPSGNLHSRNGVIANSVKINDGGYNDSFINKFKLENNFNGDLKLEIRSNEQLRNDWLNFKMNLLSEFVRDLTTSIKNANQNIKITAAVMPNINTAKNVYGQDWDLWIENGYLDGLEPMIYSGDSNYVLNALTDMALLVNDRAEITVGLYPEDGGADIHVLAEQISKLTKHHAVGVSRFSSRTIFAHPYAKEAMKHMKHENITQSNFSDELIFYAYISDLYEKTNNYYQYVIEVSNIIDYLDSINLIEKQNYYDIILRLYDEIISIDNEIIKNRLLITNKQLQNLLK